MNLDPNHKISVQDLQCLASTLDNTLNPLASDGVQYYYLLMTSVAGLLDPAIVSHLINNRLANLDVSLLPHTHAAINSLSEKTNRTRQLLTDARQKTIEAANLLNESLVLLRDAVVKDKQSAMSAALTDCATYCSNTPTAIVSESCYLCTEQLQKPVAWINNCSCLKPNVACRPCVERQVYSSTNGIRKSEARCSFCRHAFTIDDVCIAP